MNEPFNHINFTLGSTTKPPETYTEAGQAFVPKISDDKFYVFGGTYPMNNKSSEYFQEPPERNVGDLWSYSGSNRTWKLETPNYPNVQRITDGSGTVDYLEEVIYYAQGNYIDAVVRDFPEGARLPVDGLLSLHTTDPQPVWKNETIPGGASVFKGFLHYVPFGKRGVLVFFGGERRPKGTFNGASEMVSCKPTNPYLTSS